MPDSARHRLLILGGTGEAAALARAVTDAMPDLAVVTSLAGRTRDPVLPPGEVRIGGFGGIDGLAGYIEEHAVSMVVNATHPFAAEMSAHALDVHRDLGIPLLRLLRPAWHKQPGDSWIAAHSLKAAADVCRWLGRRVLLSVGARDLSAFAGLARPHFILRLVDPPAEPPPLMHYDLITARGPFALADERLLILEHGIDLIITKNSGGDATYAKIEIARELGIPVVMVDRPEIARHTGCDTVQSVETAIDWITERCGDQAAPTLHAGDRA